MDKNFNFENQSWKTIVIVNNKGYTENILFKPIYYQHYSNDPLFYNYSEYMAIPINVTSEEILLFYDNSYEVEDFIDLFL